MSDAAMAPAPVIKTVRDQILSIGQNEAEVVALAKVADPALYDALQTKGLLWSKSLYGVPICLAATWALAKYGLSLPPDDIAVLCFVVTTAATAGFRAISGGIEGFFKKKGPPLASSTQGTTP